MPRRRLNAAWVGMGCGVALTGFSAGWLANAREPEPRVATLVSSGQTVAGETIAYPEGAPAQVTAVILTLQPGEKTGLHTHGVPTFGYVLEGELTVSYEGQGNRIYKAGDGVLEAMRIPHDGRNSGASTMRILAVFMGAEGVALSVPAKNSRLE